MNDGPIGRDDDDGALGVDLAERVERLERRLEVREDVADRVLRAEVARAVQSVGIVIDYLAERGLLDRTDMLAHIERHFLVMGAPTAADPHRQAIDVHGWLIWAEFSSQWRTRPRKPASAVTAPSSGSRPRSSGRTYAELEGESGRQGNLEIEPVET